MNKTKLMINGLPGNLASSLLNDAFNLKNFEVLAYSLTGEDTKTDSFDFNGRKINLLKPSIRDVEIKKILEENTSIIAIDYTHPNCVNDNAQFYVENKMPFVMGTTGGDRKKLEEDVKNSEISAVIAPNMAKQIVGFQAMMEFAAKNFPDLFKNYNLKIKESHQSGKADTSGTAKAMVDYFKALGLDFNISMIEKERDRNKQISELKIPEKYINGHAWHTYTIESKDKNIKFEFTHNINGRDIYSNGTMDAVNFLRKKTEENIKGKVYSMIDVLKG